MHIPPLPEPSKIKYTDSGRGLEVIWKEPDNVRSRWMIIGFLTFWLIFWCFGEIDAAQKVWIQFQQSGSIDYYLAFWLTGWTIGGGFAAIIWGILLRGTGYSRLYLKQKRLRYRPGNIPLVKALKDTHRFNPDFVLGANPYIKAARSQVRNLQLIKLDSKAKLYFDWSNKRIELGHFLSDADKEWLHYVIRNWLADPPLAETSTQSVENLSEVPGGSTIRVRHTPAGCMHIEWKEPSPPSWIRIMLMPFFLCWLGGWSWMGVEMGQPFVEGILIKFSTLLQPERWVDIVLLPISLIMTLLGAALISVLLFYWVLGLVTVAISVVCLILGTGKTELVLSPHRLQYRVGREPSFTKDQLSGSKDASRKTQEINIRSLIKNTLEHVRQCKEALMGKAPVTIERIHIRHFCLRPAEQRSKLLVKLDHDHSGGSGSVELGQHLSAVEVEWLYDTINSYYLMTS